MKRKRFIFAEMLVFLLIFGLIGKPGNGNSFVPELHGKAVNIYFNDIVVTDWGDALPFIDQNGRTMIPLRFYSEKIGCSVDWSQKDKKITIIYIQKDYYGNSVSKKLITLWVNNRKTYVYDSVIGETKTIWLDTVPWQEPKYPWRVYVPLRFVSSCLGDIVTWFPQGATPELFPDITFDKDTVMIAHFIPEGPNDYLIVPGERYGKYLLKMPIEQFMKYWGKISRIYCGSQDAQADPRFAWRKDKYVYDFSSEIGRASISFAKDEGVVGISFYSGSDIVKGQELSKYHLSSANNKYYLFKWYDIGEFERDFPFYTKIHKSTILRRAREVESRTYTYKGFEIWFWEDYQKNLENYEYRGWFVELLWLWNLEYSADYFFNG